MKIFPELIPGKRWDRSKKPILKVCVFQTSLETAQWLLDECLPH